MQINTGSILATGSIVLPYMSAWSFNETASWQPVSYSVSPTMGVNQLMINGNTELSSTYNIEAQQIVADNSLGTQWVFMDTSEVQHYGGIRIPVNTSMTYSFSCWIKSSGSVQSNAYVGYTCFDKYGNVVALSYLGGWGNTYLTAQLNNGDKTASLLSVAGFTDTAGLYYFRYLNAYPPGDADYYTPYTYTRIAYEYQTRDLANNKLYFTAGWPGGTVPSGSPVSNGRAGSTYSYVLWVNPSPVPTTWTYLSASLKGEGNDGLDGDYTKFRWGTTHISWMTLSNYAGVGNGFRYGGIVFGNTNDLNDADVYRKQMSVSSQNIVICSGLNEIV